MDGFYFIFMSNGYNIFALYLGNMTFAGVGGLVFIVWIIRTFNVRVGKSTINQKKQQNK